MLLAMGLLAALASSDMNAELETFPIGFWNYAPIEVFDKAKIQEWQDAGITLTLGPNYTATPKDIAHMKRVLDWSEARGIKVIVCDPRIRIDVPLSPDFARKAAQAASDFGAHRATFGFRILDEPDKDKFQATCDAVRSVKSAAPKLHPFVNLLPWHDGVKERVGYDNWQTYLDDFIKNSGAEFLCYDCYTQMLPGQTGWPTYFKNLNEYRVAAQRNGIPFWTTILSVGHYHYREPTESDIRWQFNSSIAYGAQGILYFFFYIRRPQENYRLAPIDEFYDRTPLFDALKRQNKGFIKRYGRLFLDLRCVKPMQFPTATESCQKFEPDELIASVTTDGNRPIIISRFKDKEDRPWVVIVNNSTEESCLATLALKGANSKAWQLDWDSKPELAKATTHDGQVEVSRWLAPGQMQVYRVEPRP